ncbi:zinc ABC transporter substrate-binding protein [Roseicyclus persicicus]|uniref:High-affinity zinc uptake system protein ZnuA n=1 Tax=Roseicyclus persicicus TaxID=2650661 RepID=A0A7X6JYP0_9RHOB|nr:zinc ABC transporter substrate-binding protein [Roseibacterium persicicum]NKX43963.1 zinc ABC transporter solute-binding protein [Roseibacterium persicicum]
MRAPIFPCLTALPIVLSAPALADVPRVAVDIAPVHALVAQVMAGVGTPDLILPPGASPHAYALRPSEAGALQEAELVVWVGEGLTPWLGEAIGTLAGGAARLELMEVEGTLQLAFREGATFEAHEHAHGDDHAHGADDHDHDHDHDHEEHDHDDHAHDDHAHGAFDPHGWLDPVNAALWLDAIAAELSRIDPDNAAAYAANAAAGREGLAALEAEIAGRLAPLSGGFIVFHDGYHYFEARFGIEAAGAISLSDASDPGPARVAEIRDLVASQGIACVFAEPQFNRGLVDAVFGGTGVRVGVIDPIGASLTPGPDLYADLLRGMAAAFEDCLAAG